MKKFKLGSVQISAKADKDRNLKRADELIREAAEKGCQVVALPEMWNCPYNNKYFKKFAEDKYSKTYNFLKETAKKYNILLVGGSIPILKDDKIYNEAFVFDKNGEEIYSYKKIYMFDVVFENGKEFRESDNVEAGNQIGVFDTEYGKFGLVICYDLRFYELFENMHKLGAECIFVPGSFTKETGKKHWELLLRARAVDFQSFIIGSSMARDDEISKNVFGNSRIVGPGGEILASIDENEGIIISDIDLSEINKNRKLFPIEKSRLNKIKVFD